MERVEDLARRARLTINDPRTGYEDQVYLVPSLWAARPATGKSDDIVDISERVLAASPGLLYLGEGAEDLAATVDDRIPNPVSDLYRAMVLDVILRTEQEASTRMSAQLDERYRGRRAVTIAAFGSYLILIVLIWLTILWPLVAWRQAADQYWLEQQFGAMSVWGAILYALDVALVTIAIPCTRVAVNGLWDVLVRAHAESDQRLRDIVWTHLKALVTSYGCSVKVKDS